MNSMEYALKKAIAERNGNHTIASVERVVRKIDKDSANDEKTYHKQDVAAKIKMKKLLAEKENEPKHSYHKRNNHKAQKSNQKYDFSGSYWLTHKKPTELSTTTTTTKPADDGKK